MSLGEVLEKLDMNIVEFGICAGFWGFMVVMSSFISLTQVLRASPLERSTCARLTISNHAAYNNRARARCASPPTPCSLSPPAGFPPIAIAISVFSFAGDYASLVGSVLGILGMLYGLYYFRAQVGKSIVFLLRKVTGKRK